MASTPGANAPAETWIALLGCRDLPVDGVEDYCTFLGHALPRLGIGLKHVRVQWIEDGWLRALRQLWRDAASWRGKWVLVQYTALGWSRRGFPFAALVVLTILRRRGVRCAIVFHDPWRHPGARWIDRVRGACQDWVIHSLYRKAAKCIFADPLQTIPWLPGNDRKSVFIPVGANIPERLFQTSASAQTNGAVKTVAIFCLTAMPAVRQELVDISNAASVAAKSGANFRILFMGRGTVEARQEIVRAFQGIPVEISNLGLLSAEQVSDVLARADAMLCVRGRLYPRRGSAIAGIACGLPIIAYAGEAEGTPLAEAGLVLVPYRDTEALGAALTRVLADANLQRSLHEKSLRAQQQYFSWDRIAASYVGVLGDLGN